MIYFDNAATTFPKPEYTYYYINKYTRKIAANPGRGSYGMAVKSAEIIYETRAQLAKFFNIKDSMNVVFTGSCTESLNMAIKGILKQGDHVITTSMEHNSVLRPLMKISGSGVEVTIVQANELGMIKASDIEKEIKSNTKMILISHVSNVTGTIMPIREIGDYCRKKGIIFMVDAAQSAGILDIDVELFNIDILAFPGHKNLFGPMGVGGLYIGDNIDLETIIEGGTGSVSNQLTQPIFMPDKFESGTPNLSGIAGLKGGLEFISEIGLSSITKHEENLVVKFTEKICSTWNIEIYGPKESSNKSGIVLMNIKNMDSSELAYILDYKYKIAARPGFHCAPLAHKTIGTSDKGAVRFSFSYFNTEKEVDMVTDYILKIAKKHI